MVTAPTFYNLKDQGIYSAGDFFIPQEKYRAAPYTVKKPNNPDEVPAGIPTVYQPQGSADGFDPYNTNMSTIRQDYDPFPSRQAGEIYSKTFNPQSTFDPNLTRAQNTANLIRTYESGTGPGVMRLGNTVFDASKFSPGQRASLLKSADNFIDDARMQYATEGQYVDPYDPNYSSITEAQKFMDNYPDYYGVPSGVPEEGIPGAIKNYMQNSLLGRGFGMAKDFLGRVMPINERAIMENEARGAGIFTDDIGRIVTDDYNTAGGIMAGYNLNKIDAGSFQKRRDTINEKMSDRINPETGKTFKQERLDLLDEAEAKILGARKKTKQVYKMRKDKKDADKKRREEEKAAAAAAAQAERNRVAQVQSRLNTGNYVDRDSGGYSASDRAVGGGREATNAQGQNAAQATSAGTGTSQGYSQHYMDGGRVYYMNGGLADMLEIYD